jgi:hypothetical protein
VATSNAADGPGFSGLIEKVEGEARASYSATMSAGGDGNIERGSKSFATEREARVWIEHEAAARGFTSYSLSIKYPPSRTSAAASGRAVRA